MNKFMAADHQSDSSLVYNPHETLPSDKIHLLRETLIET